MDPKKWGPPLWKYLYSMADAYDHIDPRRKQKYRHFFENLGETLPCERCSHHYKRYLSKKQNHEALLDAVHHERAEGRKLRRWLGRLQKTIRNQNLELQTQRTEMRIGVIIILLLQAISFLAALLSAFV